MARIVLDHVSKLNQIVTVVNDLSLTIEDQEITVLLGPAGCGHTAVLRLLAGLEEPTSGQIVIGEEIVNGLSDQPGVAVLAALNPRMTVYQNLAAQLKAKRWSPVPLDARVRELAADLGIQELLGARPKELTYRQRLLVSIGATLSTNPKVVLMNQPLASFCGLLKDQLRQELARLIKRFQLTVVYATHDAIEAMSLADKVVVMRDGSVHQVGSPQVVYNEPADLFAAHFLGNPPINLIRAQLVQEDGALYLSQGLFRLPVPTDRWQMIKFYIGQEVVVGIRPEHLTLIPGYQGAGGRSQRAKVELAEFLGAETVLHLTLDTLPLIARIPMSTKFMPGEWVQLVIDTTKVHLFDKQTELRIT